MRGPRSPQSPATISSEMSKLRITRATEPQEPELASVLQDRREQRIEECAAPLEIDAEKQLTERPAEARRKDRLDRRHVVTLRESIRSS